MNNISLFLNIIVMCAIAPIKCMEIELKQMEQAVERDHIGYQAGQQPAFSTFQWQPHTPPLHSLLMPERQEIVKLQHTILKEHELVGACGEKSKIWCAIAAIGGVNVSADILLATLCKESLLPYSITGAVANTVIAGTGIIGALVRRKHTNNHTCSLITLKKQRDQTVCLDDKNNQKAEETCALQESLGRHEAAYCGWTLSACLTGLNMFKDVALGVVTHDEPFESTALACGYVNAVGGVIVGAMAIYALKNYLKESTSLKTLQAELDQLMLAEQQLEEV